MEGMTTIIGLISQKGGVGKSTIARALACGAAADGLRVKINRVQFENRGPAARTGDPECGQFSRATNGGTVVSKLDAV
jgi:predicted kinase